MLQTESDVKWPRHRITMRHVMRDRVTSGIDMNPSVKCSYANISVIDVSVLSVKNQAILEVENAA